MVTNIVTNIARECHGEVYSHTYAYDDTMELSRAAAAIRRQMFDVTFSPLYASDYA